MDSKLLILRFRDPEETINTIDSHMSIIDDMGAVRWGWWKKESEHLDANENDILSNYKHKHVYLINRDSNKLYKANVKKICNKKPNRNQLTQIPSYYRGSAKKVYTWFVITNIEEMPTYSSEYDSMFAELGNPTYLITSLSSQHVKKNTALNRKEISSNKILVLSDLHFGEDYNFCLKSELNDLGQSKDTLHRTLFRDLESLHIHDKIGLIVITGDFTTKGKWDTRHKLKIINEIHDISGSLGLTNDKIIVLPGNHDILRNTYNSLAENNVDKLSDDEFELEFRCFAEELTGRHRDEKLSYNAYYRVKDSKINFDITILNSCKIVPFKGLSEYGSVGVEGIDTIRNLESQPDQKTQRILFVHHHLLPVYDIESIDTKPSLSIDSLKILKTSLQKNIKLAMHGHQHVFSMAKYSSFDRTPGWNSREISVVAGGSTGINSKGMKSSERNSYSILTINENEIKIQVREIMHSEDAGTTILDHSIT